jgi:hypothetical protein
MCGGSLTLLHHCVETNRLTVFQFLIREKQQLENLNQKNIDGYTPLHLMCKEASRAQKQYPTKYIDFWDYIKDNCLDSINTDIRNDIYEQLKNDTENTFCSPELKERMLEDLHPKPTQANYPGLNQKFKME